MSPTARAWAPADDLARRRLSPALAAAYVPVPQTRVVRSYGLSHPSHAAALAVCRAELGQPPMEAPAALDWQTVCAQLS